MAGRRAIPPTKRGYDFGEVISALQKCIRRGETDDALYWAWEAIRTAEEINQPGRVWNRLLIIASEDVGIAEPGIAAEIRALRDNAKEFKNADNPDVSRLFMTHAVIRLCTAKKSRLTDWALLYHRSDNVSRREVPDFALDKHTLRGKRMGRGWDQFFDEGTHLENRTEAFQKAEEAYKVLARKIETGDTAKLAVNPWKGPDEEFFPPVHNIPDPKEGE